jgi:hypothetical protein
MEGFGRKGKSWKSVVMACFGLLIFIIKNIIFFINFFKFFAFENRLLKSIAGKWFQMQINRTWTLLIRINSRCSGSVALPSAVASSMSLAVYCGHRSLCKSCWWCTTPDRKNSWWLAHAFPDRHCCKQSGDDNLRMMEDESKILLLIRSCGFSGSHCYQQSLNHNLRMWNQTPHGLGHLADKGNGKWWAELYCLSNSVRCWSLHWQLNVCDPKFPFHALVSLLKNVERQTKEW